MQKLTSALKSNQGFTLVELITVIVILGILMTLVVPTFNSVMDRANQTTDVGIARNIYKSVTANVVANRQVDMHVNRLGDKFKDAKPLKLRDNGMGFEGIEFVVDPKKRDIRDITEFSAYTGLHVDWENVTGNAARMATRYLNVAFTDAGVEALGDSTSPIENSALFLDHEGSVGVLYVGEDYIVCILNDDTKVTKK